MMMVERPESDNDDPIEAGVKSTNDEKDAGSTQRSGSGDTRRTGGGSGDTR